ncbi:hypothetical protein [Streptomyces sp. OR43]|uniref:hypothetical protein n=1 Tax=Streptomyces sp. or43 TaxID=2478957 RepID=UPI0011CD6A05|nr:hypothetical protein [Streptomyces sp. or43]TXS42020.1 hypothetical protein EAO72_15370 [Streptomyces sp. or43]
MGVYLISVGAEEWFGEEEGWGEIATALNEGLRQRGLPPYESVPDEPDFVRGSGQAFEEKLSRSMAGFDALCEEHLSHEETETLSNWSVLVPFSLDEEILLPIGSAYSESSTVVAGAPQVLAVAQRLATAIELPAETPRMCDNLDLTMWFREGAAEELAAARPGPWADDLDAAFYVALFLRAAEHSVRRGCPVVYC